jgi:hypothetical protein
VRDAEGVPENDVGVGDVCGGVRGDPGWDALGGLARGLWDVAAGGVDLGVVVWSDVSKASFFSEGVLVTYTL